MKQLGSFYPVNFVYLFAICVSMLISFWIYSQVTIINPDAICYLLSAERVGEIGIRGAMNLCGQAHWPFYSMLIYAFVSISHLSYENAAYFIDAIFSLISVVTFILIVKELNEGMKLRKSSSALLWLAALVILLSHQFNSAREYIIRDHGFWALYLVSVLLLLRFFKQPLWFYGLAWSVSLLFATLFRIEGAIFLIGLPFLTWLRKDFSFSRRCVHFFQLNLVTLFIAFFLGGWVLLHPEETLQKLGRVAELSNQWQQGLNIILERFHSVKTALATHVLTIDSAKQAGLVLTIVLITWYVISAIINLSLAYTLLLGYAFWRKTCTFNSEIKLVLFGYIIINVAVTFGFMLEHLFLSKRYLIALSLIGMLWVPFALDDLVKRTQYVRDRLFLIIMMVLIFLSSLGGIFDFGYSKSYILKAGLWLDENIPLKAQLFVNDYQLMYYSHHFKDSIFQKLNNSIQLDMIAHDGWKTYDYLALRLPQKKKQEMAFILRDIKLTPIKIFSNARGDQVAVYRVK